VHVALLLKYQMQGDESWSPEEHPIKGRILDLSDTGCSLFTSQCLEIGQKLSVVIVMKKGTEISTRGVVRWSKRVVEKRGYVSGVEFDGLGKRDKNSIASFLQRLDETVGL
jgi:c-di-GMP-binding flagellar brake protein YcgR